MTNTTRLTRPVRFALVASVALGASPILAQASVEPIPTPVEATPAPAIAPPPAPTIVVPDVVPSPPASATVTPAEDPVAAPAPEPAPAAARNVTPKPAAAPVARTAPRVAAPVADGAPNDQSSPTPVAEPVIAESLAPPMVEPVAVPPVAEPAPPPATANANSWGPFAVAAGILAILILALWGFVAAARRRKAPFKRMAVPVIERPVVAPREIEPAPAPVETDRVQPAHLAASGALHGGLPHAGASVALPRVLPESFAERDALFRRMVAAAPDRANPFTERRARTKRARLILQSLGRDFGDTRPWIDLSQYPNNWPELARHKSAAA